MSYTPPNPVQLGIVVGVLSALSIVGTVGNILVLMVFRKKQDRLVSTLLIIVLAFVDLTTCLGIVPYTIYMELSGFQVRLDAVCKLYQFLITSNIPFSAMIMVAIAVDRYLAICHPFLHMGDHSLPVAKLTVLVLAMFAASFGLSVSLNYGIYAIAPDVSPTWQPTIEHYGGNSTQGMNHDIDHPSTMGLSIVVIPDLKNGEAPLPRASTAETNRDYDVNVVHSLSDAMTESGVMLPENGTLGVCGPDMSTIEYLLIIQKIYNGVFLACFIVVATLYVLIYRSVLARRQKHLNQKRKSRLIVTKMTKRRDNRCAGNDEDDGTDLVALQLIQLSKTNSALGGDDNLEEARTEDAALELDFETRIKSDLITNNCGESTLVTTTTTVKNGRSRRKKSLSCDGQLVANLKTAAMLFVVTVVFIVTYLPAFLMTLSLLPYNVVVFYMYFANNVANPFIYSFMNSKFRDELTRLVCTKR